MNPDISIIITAFNEENSITPAFLDIKKAARKLKINSEIIIINDCSTDKTQEKIEKIISKNLGVLNIVNNGNCGPGKSFTNGVKQASGKIVIWMPADTEVKSLEYLKHIKYFKDYDILTFYHINPKSRSLIRFIISFIFTYILNFFFSTNLKYFNGPTAIKKEIYLQFIPRSNRFFFAAESKIKAIKKGYKNIQVPIKLEEKQQYRSFRNIITPLRPINIVDVLISFLILFWEIYFSKKFRLIKRITA